ncbi:PH domain-containing protein [bacterium]|nr:PH domain-containing protein [bacterium]
MDNTFRPPRQTGLLIQGAVALAFLAAGGYFFFLATQDAAGLDFLLHMVIALVLLAPLPVVGYRLYALLVGAYVLRRDGLQIRWGLRREDIPLNDIEWIRPATELGFRLPMPWLRWPGAIIGSRRVAELGPVEFLAADLAHMLLVATPEKIFAISPEDVGGFMALFRQMNEMGSLAPLQPQSVYPRLLVGRVWEDRIARRLILAGLAVGLVLLGVVAIAVPGLETIAWLTVGETAPSERLLLLPVLAGLLWLVDLVIGIFAYRRGDDMQLAAYFLWGTSAITGVLLLVGSLIFIF